MLIGLRDAAKRYHWGGPWVLREVTLSVSRGSVVEVRGANGSGKSTLLRLLAGATLPTRGVRLADAGIGVGYGPERLAPAPPFTAAGYLRHHVRLRGGGHERGRRAGELAERLALTSLLPERLAELSKGSLQKVVLIQALLDAPDLLVLDEPFSGLDADATSTLRELLAEYAVDGATVVFSDHREVGERPRADVTWWLADGSVHEHAVDSKSPYALDALDLPGAIDVREDQGQIVLLVSQAQSDRILKLLLARSWHIRSVESDADGELVRIRAASRERA